MKVEGYIFDKQTNAPINDGVITLVDMNTGSKGPFYQLQNNSYSAWAEIPDAIAVYFDSPGHKAQVVPITKLATSPDIYLDKSLPIAAIAAAAGILLLTSKKKKGSISGTKEKLTTSDVMPFVLIGGALLSWNIIQQILDKLGLGSDKNVRDEQTDPNSEWKPDYWRKFTSYTYAITESQAGEFAKTIHNAFTVFQDDFNAIWSVIAQMRTKANVSFLNWKFIKEYNEDLLSFLTDGGGVLPWDGLSKKHMDQIINYVNNLPTN
jgi:hypothetical protein